MKRLSLYVVVAAGLAACKPFGPPAPGALQKSFERLPRAPACAAQLPMEWVSTWPVPTGAEEGRQFVALFYSLDRSLEGADGLPRIRVTVPRGQAVFNSQGAVASCEIRRSLAAALPGERYPPAAMRLEEDQFDEAVAKFMRLTETMAGYYARRASKPDAYVIAAYWTHFEQFAEPALWPYYYKANPEYWEWLREINGKSIPPAGI